MVEPHLLLPSVYVFLPVEEDRRGRNDRRSVARRRSSPALSALTH